MARAVIDGGNAAGASVGRADVDLVTSFARSPGDMNPAYGSGVLVSSTVKAQAENLYSLGNQLALVVDLSSYPLYALTSQFLTDIEAVITALAGNGPDYGELLVVLHDGVDGGTYGYQGSSTKAYLTAPSAVTLGGSSGAWTATISYPSSGSGIPPGIPVVQSGDNIYLDEVVGITGLAPGEDGASLPTASTLVDTPSNGVAVNSFTGSGVLYLKDASGFSSSGTVTHIDPSYGTAVITYTGKSGNTLTGCTTTVLTGSTPGSNVLVTGDYVWQATSPPIFVDLSGPYTITGTPTTAGGVTTFTISTGATPVVALNPSVQVSGATPMFGGRLKTDSSTAIAHAGYTSTTYLTALLSGFASLRTTLGTTFATATGDVGHLQVGLGLTGMNWTASTLTLPSSITTALSSADFAALNLRVPMASWSTGVQALRWAAAQLHGLTSSGQTMVSWFDLYDPTVPLYHDATHYTTLTTDFQSFLSAVFTDARMTELTGNGLMAWNWYNDDYLNTADYGTSYASLVAATDRYAQVQHFLGAQFLAAGGHITATPTQPLTAGARIQAATSAMLAAGAHIAAPGSATLGAGARIVLTPVVTLSAGARIVSGASSPISAGARIQTTPTQTLAAGARIVYGGTATISAGAHIAAPATQTLGAGARIAVAGSNSLTAGGWLSVTPVVPLAAGARIQATGTQTLAAGGQIAPANVEHKTLVAGARIKAQATASLGAGAIILGKVVPPSRTFTTKARTRTFTPDERTFSFVSTTRSRTFASPA